MSSDSPVRDDGGDAGRDDAAGPQDSDYLSQLPAETLTQIIAHIVADGLQVSNSLNPEHSNIEALRSLLFMNKQIHAITKHQVYNHPLRFYLNSGRIGENNCTCGFNVGDPLPPTFPTIRCAGRLPLHKWPGVVICLAPTIQDHGCAFHQPNYDFEPVAYGFEKAVRCVIRHSSWIARTIKVLHFPAIVAAEEEGEVRDNIINKEFRSIHNAVAATNPKSKEPLRLALSYEKIESVLSAEEQRSIPLWTMEHLRVSLLSWKWMVDATTAETLRRHIILPSPFSAIFVPTTDDIPEFEDDEPQKLAERLETAFLDWCADSELWDPESLIQDMGITPPQEYNPAFTPSAIKSKKIGGFAVLRVTLCKVDGSWKGEFVEFKLDTQLRALV
ncbi:hypothetical protein H2200_011693 [Cladophialophora chaetospira]|uniref:Uncharacterized protein n=1 Tax=Cladophialophora chaetospira TaxID=386627 RepID=A0AA38WYI2_9EURO|nr:hypothetical protein H2200_011693 [Cladophialophora chaetospira]